jgi:GTP-binding protein
MKIVKRFGMKEMDLKTAYAGDIVSIAGFTDTTVGHTVNPSGKTDVIPSIPIDPPMLAFTVTFNDSPLKGIDGDKLTMSQLRERFTKEAQDDVSLKVETAIGSDNVVIQGRGDLHLGVILEKMRREGYEMAISPPSVVTKKVGDQTLEPFEDV